MLEMLIIINKLLSIIFLTLLLPIIVIIAVIIRLDSKGPIIFKQKRMGKGKSIFTLYKFRTMITGADKIQKKYKHLNQSDGPAFKIDNDPRFTNFGRVLSKSGLDELPQLVNIIKGEMTFVGPRPLPTEEAKKIPKKYGARFSALPGITSSWVVKGAHSLKFKKWMSLDLGDIKNKSFLYDLKIVLSTMKVIFRGSYDSIKRLLNP